MTGNNQLCKKVAEIYDWLNSQTRYYSKLCRACGKCCDFENHDHRLFVTTPELIYLAANIDAENIKPMTTSRCPYNTAGKCSIYKHRFIGCRTFCCKADTDFQSRLTETTLAKIKSLCAEYQINYQYCDLATALNSFAG